MAYPTKRSKLLRFSLAAFALSGGGFGAGCSGSGDEAAEAETASSSAALVVSTDLVISQVYGGGGNTGAPYTHDFVELFNRGTSTASLGGKSLQYASSSLNFSNAANVVALPSASVPPGGYYLVQLATQAAVGSPLPTPDLVTAGPEMLGLKNDTGKVALVDSTALLNNCGAAATPCADGGWIDFVGYGNTAAQFETAHTASLSNTTAAIRGGAGCFDTGDNAADFSVGAPAPHNSSTPAIDCAHPPDAGLPPPDAGVVDSGGASDAGAIDSGSTSDAGKSDAGVKLDAGAKKDSAVPADDDAGDTPPDDEEDADSPSPTPSSKDAGKKDSGVKSTSSITTTPTSANREASGCSVSAAGVREGSGTRDVGGLGALGLALAAITRRRRK
jgi:MYXO-CTERM domain-containing protein